MDYSLPDSSIHGIFQARILEWVAISFSRGSFRPRDQTRVSGIAGRLFTVWASRESQVRPVIEGHILYDSTYISSLEQLIIQGQKAEWWLPGARKRGGGESYYFISWFSLRWSHSGDRCWWWLLNNMNALTMPLNCKFKYMLSHTHRISSWYWRR